MQLARHESTNFALGGNTTIGIIAERSQEEFEELASELWQNVFRFEKLASRFLETSELTYVNRRAGLETTISEQFAELLSAAKTMSERTGGLYNPFLLPAIQRAGYLHSAVPGFHDDPVPDFRTRHLSDWQNLKLSDTTMQIPSNTALDMGGIGKGFLADKLGETLRSAGVNGYWVNLSGDIAVYGTDEHGRQLQVAVDGADHVIECPTEPSGIATSGTMPRPGHTELHSAHIIDPSTGTSVKSTLRRVTVCAPTATEADVFASCAIIVGRENAPAWLEEHGATSWLFDTNTTEVKQKNA